MCSTFISRNHLNPRANIYLPRGKFSLNPNANVFVAKPEQYVPTNLIKTNTQFNRSWDIYGLSAPHFENISTSTSNLPDEIWLDYDVEMFSPLRGNADDLVYATIATFENIKHFINTSEVKIIIGAHATYSPSLNTTANTFGKILDAHDRPFVPNIFAKPPYIFNSNLNPSATIFTPNFYVDSVINYMNFNQGVRHRPCTQLYSLNPNADIFISRVPVNSVRATHELDETI